MRSKESWRQTHGERPRECAVSRYRHGCDPPAHKGSYESFSLLQRLSADSNFKHPSLTEPSFRTRLPWSSMRVEQARMRRYW